MDQAENSEFGRRAPEEFGFRFAWANLICFDWAEGEYLGLNRISERIPRSLLHGSSILGADS